MTLWLLNPKIASFITRHLHSGFDLFLDTVFPKYCVTCGSEGEHLCKSCFQKTTRVHWEGNLGQGKMIIAGSYKNRYLKEVIHFLKYRYIKDLSIPLAEFIADSMRQKLPPDFLNSKKTIIVPVPLHPRKLKWRGFNQTGLIAQKAGEYFTIPAISALGKTRNTPAQMEIKERSRRLKNLNGAFYCHNPKLVKGKNIILLDDVITTGATLKECEDTLKKAGAKEIWKVAVAG